MKKVSLVKTDEPINSFEKKTYNFVPPPVVRIEEEKKPISLLRLIWMLVTGR